MTWDMEQFEMFWAFYLQIRASSPGAQLIDLIFGQDSRNTQSKHIFHRGVGATITRSDILPENSAKEIYQIKLLWTPFATCELTVISTVKPKQALAWKCVDIAKVFGIKIHHTWRLVGKLPELQLFGVIWTRKFYTDFAYEGLTAFWLESPCFLAQHWCSPQ
mgnify:CR=1 FL=1